MGPNLIFGRVYALLSQAQASTNMSLINEKQTTAHLSEGPVCTTLGAAAQVLQRQDCEQLWRARRRRVGSGQRAD